MVGDVGIGGNNPIRVQSMTTTDTMDTKATVAQSIRMIEAGCELVRITAPSLNDARNLEQIKKELREQGYHTPLVADIHFTPNAAEHAARVVEKVRVNPGNYADKKKFEHIDYTEAGYEAELARIRDRFVPLVKICKEHGTAMRIGTNHGSLSDRIMSRYGDTALGMVESALEFLRICEEFNYHQIVLSMKSSNTQVMVQAYRLLVHKMMELGMNYPLHLGVTEAGEGEDGRIKSAVGIGTLLEDGLGDTIRVSLTEDPEFELPVARKLVERYAKRKVETTEIAQTEFLQLPYNPFEHNKRPTVEVINFGGANVPRVVMDISDIKEIKHPSLFPLGYRYSVPLDKWNISDVACDYIFAGYNFVGFEIPGTLGIIYDYHTWVSHRQVRSYPLLNVTEFEEGKIPDADMFFVATDSHTLTDALIRKLGKCAKAVLVLSSASSSGIAAQRFAIARMMQAGVQTPVIMRRSYLNSDTDTLQLHAATDFGALLVDGLGDGVWVDAGHGLNPTVVNNTCFGILQASRTRTSKTEYISCPSCGRTLFDLQQTTARIRTRTDHLKGLKIGIMGCIVNGPGEMADADYGYVGTGPGKITLYKGKEVVKRNVPSNEAVDELIELIRAHGDWVEKTE